MKKLNKANQYFIIGPYLMTHSMHFIYGYMASDIWSKTIQIAREDVLLPYGLLFSAPSHRQDSTYHGIC